MEEENLIQVGDKVIVVPYREFDNIKELPIGNIYTVKQILSTEETETNYKGIILEEVEIKEKSRAYRNGFIYNRFKKYISPIQDNEFVKMMCSNERMLDI